MNLLQVIKEKPFDILAVSGEKTFMRGSEAHYSVAQWIEEGKPLASEETMKKFGQWRLPFRATGTLEETLVDFLYKREMEWLKKVSIKAGERAFKDGKDCECQEGLIPEFFAEGFESAKKHVEWENSPQGRRHQSFLNELNEKASAREDARSRRED